MIANITMEMIDYFEGDVRRINHALKVHSFCRLIGEKELATRPDKHQLLTVIELSAILHDIGIKVSEEKYRSSSGKFQEMEGPDIARAILEKHEVDPDVIDRVCFIIGNHHTYKKIDGLDFQILVESDFLVNFYEDDLSIHGILTAKDKYFRTSAGRRLADSLYLRS